MPPSSSQTAEALGRNNVIVQIQGDGNRVGLAHLTLTRYLNRRLSEETPAGEAAEILSPYALSIPLVGRDRELADLHAWLEKDPTLHPVSIRVLVARGGGGKTRLALELCDQATRKGWDAGFVTDGELKRFFAQQNLSTWGWHRPTLIVIDYAAARARSLRDWLVELADNAADSRQPLRLLLLERHADPASGWWTEAFGQGGGDALAVRKLLDPPDGPRELSPLLAAEERQAVLRETLQRVGSKVTLPVGSPDFERKLAELTWGGEPLFLMMAGLTAARCGLGYVLALSPNQIAFDVAKHEINRIRQIAASRGLSEVFVAHMAAYVTLCQGLEREEGEQAIADEARALRYSLSGDPPEIYRVLLAGLPASDGELAPILPDVVGEAAILTVLGDGNPEKALAAVARAASKARRRVAATVLRTARDFGAERSEALAWLARIGQDGKASPAALAEVVDQLPRNTVFLREAAAKLSEAQAELLRKMLMLRPAALGAISARGARLSRLGRLEEALAAGGEAVSLYRELAAARPEAFRPDLAMSLNNLATRLYELGRREEALAAGEEVSALYRELAAARPESFLPDLAMSLNNLANLFSHLGRREEALAAGEEASAWYRDLSAARPEAFRPALAKSLNNLALRLNDLGRREEALVKGVEATSLYRELASARPEVFAPDLAVSLLNLSLSLGELGHNLEALQAVQEAVTLLLPFWKARPIAFGDWMAKMVARYLGLSERLGLEPEPSLYAELAPLLGKSQRESERSTP